MDTIVGTKEEKAGQALLALAYTGVLPWRIFLPRICSCRKAGGHVLYLLMAAVGFCDPSSLAAGTVR